jgi:hypothetical protein
MHFLRAVSALLFLATSALAERGSVSSIGCGDLKISIDQELSVVCEIVNDTEMSATKLRARVEYLAAEEFGPMASHVVDVESYEPDGLPPHGLDWIKFPHPRIPRAYLEFRDPVIRVEILEAWDRTGQRIFASESRPTILLDEPAAHL